MSPARQRPECWRRCVAGSGRSLSPVPRARARALRKLDTDDGLVRIDAKLRPEEAAILWKALEAARAQLRGRDVSAETRSRADALVALAEAFLQGGSKEHVASPVEVVIHAQPGIDGASLEDGARLDVG